MTKLGNYLKDKCVNKAEISRKTGLSKARLTELTLRTTAKLRVDEMYLIALAIGVNPADMLDSICNNLKIKKERQVQKY